MIIKKRQYGIGIQKQLELVKGVRRAGREGRRQEREEGLKKTTERKDFCDTIRYKLEDAVNIC